MKVIGIDAVTIIPGKGGAGGGIWTYAMNILKTLDQQLSQVESDIKIKVFVNKSFDLDLRHIDIIRIDLNTESFLSRMMYVHFVVPSLCKKYQIDVLHKMTPEVPFFYKGKMVITIHDFMNDFYFEKGYNTNNVFQLLKLYYFKQIEKLAVKKSALIFTNSISVTDELIRKYGNKNVLVTGPGNSLTEILVSCQKKTPICFCCVAGYYPHKGHMKVIELVEILVSKYGLDIKLYFRGNPGYHKYFNSILDRIRQSSCKERIVIEDFVIQDSINEIYSNASIMILLSEYEGFGLPIIEAQAIGLPVICSDISVLREVSGGYACFVSLASMENAARIVYDFLQDEQAQNWNIANGFTNVMRFQCDKIAGQLLQAYKSI
ncbi:MAG TPA: glycosyltransferase [Puia sp.]|jgi:glycosyltransferase involved in cell wall biosynthesis|nr:glycosyltransferase [Puia sp.]